MDNEILQEVSKCKSVEEVLKLAKENKYEISKEKAEELFNSTHSNGELTDSELNSVSGGGCSGSNNNEHSTKPECYQDVEYNSKEEVVYIFNEGDQVTCWITSYRDRNFFKNGSGYTSNGIIKSKYPMYYTSYGKKVWIDKYDIEYKNRSDKIEKQSFQRNEIVVK